MDRRDEASRPDYYARLGVQPSASAQEIREAYRKKARETHPDTSRRWSGPEAVERFQKVQEAYRVLRDPERREAYDAARVRRRVPDVLTINQQAPAGCGGYLWRVFAGLVAVALFFVLEAMGVWAADPWTILLGVGGAALVAGLIAAAVAEQFPSEATDVVLQLNPHRIKMCADGRTVFRLSWTEVEVVRLRQNGWTMELELDPAAAGDLQPIPPVLTRVDRRSDRALLRLELSGTDVSRNALLTFFRGTDAVPFPVPGDAATS